MLADKHPIIFGRGTATRKTCVRPEVRSSSRKAQSPDAQIRTTNLTWIGEYATLYQVHQAY